MNAAGITHSGPQVERPTMTLEAGEVHLWYLEVDGVGDWAESRREVLSNAEEDRRVRFVFEKDRRLFLAAHVLVRLVLSKYAPVAPARWDFAEAENGKPFIVAPHPGSPLRFNLSHTQGLAAVAVTLGTEVGVDVERVQGSFDETLAKTCFTSAELQWLDDVPEPVKIDRFFDLWTLKEAYLKARGTGLAAPLQGFTIQPTGECEATVSFAESIDDEERAWEFFRHRPTAAHRLAVAVRRVSTEKKLRVHLFNARND